MIVHVSTHLYAYTGGASQLEARGATLAEILDDLDARHAGIRFRVVDEQARIRPHIKFFVAGALARDLSQPVAADQEVHILAALSGG